jgi:triosephosphate isomerase
VAQVSAALEGVSEEQARDLVIAYEPIWAIGTGHVATPEDAQEVCSAIRRRVGEIYSAGTAAGTRVLYGGSVKAGNIAAIMAQADVDGGLVGGASVDAEEFAAICRYREHVTGA